MSLSLPGLTGQSSIPGRWLLDRTVKPGDDGVRYQFNPEQQLSRANSSAILLILASSRSDLCRPVIPGKV
jgi:hypothetical protein